MSTSSFSPTPVDSRKRADQVREGITAMIRAGQLQNGDKLPTETQLASMFGVGRSSVREAVQSLVGLGLVEMRPGRGAFVSRVSVADLARMMDGAVQLEFGAALQMHEVRAMIETTAARLAAVRRTDADLAAMRAANDDYANQGEHDPEDLLVEADLRFHRSIVEASHNVILVQMMSSISALLREHRRQYASARERRFRAIVLTEHQDIIDAIASGDPATCHRRHANPHARYLAPDRAHHPPRRRRLDPGVRIPADVSVAGRESHSRAVLHNISAIPSQPLHLRASLWNRAQRRSEDPIGTPPQIGTIEEHATMNRYLKSIGGVGLVALLGVTMVSGVVDAQTNGTPGAGTTVTGERTSKRDQFLSTLAGNLGVSVETLQGAFQQTVDEVGFGGRFGGMIQDRIDDRRERIIENIDLTDGAAFLGITEDELRAELQSGKSPLEIAEEHGKTQDEIRAFLIQQATERIDARLDGETTDGTDTLRGLANAPLLAPFSNGVAKRSPRLHRSCSALPRESHAAPRSQKSSAFSRLFSVDLQCRTRILTIQGGRRSGEAKPRVDIGARAPVSVSQQTRSTT